ncbi:TPA: transcriptional regulator [Enterobacter hormaechei subsp. xiangfangensis]|uniref:transcriptional regulator n=1 Tax=Enterobacter hormaechei TaxID=158836 RepID=UPI002E2AC691|nr:transcriptional regulator [Enterobacter hormaechei]MED5786239.1 transcriptional regulator [Enterobacter hormaechei]
MKGAFGKKELLAVVPLSWSTIDRLEQAGEFPSRFLIMKSLLVVQPFFTQLTVTVRMVNGFLRFTCRAGPVA